MVVSVFMSIILNFKDLKIGVYAKNYCEIKGMLMALGASGHDYSPSDAQEWHVVITDKDNFDKIPKSHIRIVMCDDQLDAHQGTVIPIPETLNLKSLHESLTKAAEVNGVSDLEFY